MKYHFFFLILLFVLTSCIEVGKPDITYLALGDSYTIGESVDPSQRWPIQLADELRRYGFDIKQPDILARTGWTTDELLAATDTARLNPPYDLVSILIGVNNQYRGLDTANYRKEMNKLMSVATEYAGGKPGKVFLVSIPDWGVTPFAQQLARDPKRIAHEINSFNRIKVELAAQNDMEYIYITDISREASNKPEYLAEDALHPSAPMYRAWVDRMMPVVKGMLEQDD